MIRRSLLFFFIFYISGLAANLQVVPELPPVVGELVTYTSPRNQWLYAIAKKYDVSARQLRLANRLRRNRARKGETLIIPKRRVAPYRTFSGMVLNLPERTVYYYQEGKLESLYPVAVGRPSMPTPAGTYKIISRVKHPTWRPPPWAGIDHLVPPGPGNPLGDRWIGISARGIGFHSTNAPTSIGWTVSHGCVRMFPWHIRKLFQKVKVGDAVEIINEPLKLGERDGMIFLEVHPHLYRKFDDEKLLTEKAEKAGVLDLIDWKLARKIIAEHRGYAQRLIGEKIWAKNVVNQKKQWTMVRKNGMLFADLSFVMWATNALRYTITKDSSLLVSQKGIVEIVPSQGTVIIDGTITSIPVAKRNDRIYLPVRLISQALGNKLSYLPEQKLLIFSSAEQQDLRPTFSL